MNKPLLICMTATRNYGWVTRAFLKANSLWADYIIIADQHSTDGTREKVLKYSKVILLDNNDLDKSERKQVLSEILPDTVLADYERLDFPIDQLKRMNRYWITKKDFG